MDNTIKMITVDDEYLIRNLIKNCISWSDLGVDIIGEASNSEEAIKLIESNKPNIILTDICMPSADGLDMSKYVLEKYPDIKIVVITGYDEFEYAKRAIKVGVSDFILKPIDDDELKNTIVRLKENIIKEKLKEKDYKQIKDRIDIFGSIIDLKQNYESEDKSLNIDEIKKFILKNISNPELSLKLLSELFYVNSSYLSRIFKLKTGMNFSEYVIGVKMKIAIDMINNSDAKSCEIAKKIGISDVNYFSVCFKKYTGHSMKEYKKLKEQVKSLGKDSSKFFQTESLFS
ncbi:DNA-binding response regulator [Clostridium zeae]|uniref:Stage 0 sporulation protein A homolog n=1 Tax=Clostridium zeae TaxID=2759022 RepID=A0ABQ1EGS6_9CLOT|nr:response regulator [Clostridium zeae]GFZ33891.1 DNA-binding response regulator [Clostridium zeae]